MSYSGISPKNPTNYKGINNGLVPAVSRPRRPTTADYRQPETGKNYPITCIWQVGANPTTGTEGEIWFLSKIVANVATWLRAGIGSAIETNTGDDSVAVFADSSGNFNWIGEAVANAANAKPVYFKDSSTANAIDLDVQVAATVNGAPIDKLDAGLSSYNNSQFVVTEHGYVSLIGGAGPAITSVLTANATPQFTQVGTTATVDFDLTNLVLGTDLPTLTSGTQNVGLGSLVGTDISSGTRNTMIGSAAGSNISTGGNNALLGSDCGTSINTGSSNVGIGHDALGTLSSGSRNIHITNGLVSGLTGSISDCINIGGFGSPHGSNTIRIGSNGSGSNQQNRCFIAGITGITVAGSAPTGIDTNGQVSSLGFGTTGQVLTSNGAATSPTWQDNGTGQVDSVTGTANQIDVGGTAADPVLSLASTIQVDGISFDGGTNTLSEYETGTWTPVVTGSTGAPSVAYTTQSGKYTRIGDLVFIKGLIVINTISGGSGNFNITGLPFTSSTDSIVNYGHFQQNNVDITASVYDVFSGVPSSSNVMSVNQNIDNAGGSSLPLSAIANGDNFTWNLTYWV